ncbi:MAG: FAD-dependent oxidoreductase [Pseudomonadota bacterium]
MTLTPDICVIGGGSAGLTVAAAASSFGHKVVLVERGKMGGDCLNYGCVPSKALIAAAKHAHAIVAGGPFGITGTVAVDYAKVHDHIHSVIAAIAPHDSVERFEGLGVTVIKDEAHFVDDATVMAGTTAIKARRTVIATGSSPFVPPIEGLSDIDPLTNESVFDLTNLPARLAIIGGGPIGAELSQAFARLGSTVTVVEAATFLSREDPDAVAIVRKSLERDGVRLLEGAAVERCERAGEGARLYLGDGSTVEADKVLVAVGRTPNIASLNLGAAGIEADRSGITVDTGLRTTNRRVYAIGDVAGGLQFTHVAGHQASLAVRSIVFRLPVRYDADMMPRTTYTAPEVAQVGLSEAEASARDPKAKAYRADLSGNDRAQTENATEGFLKLVVNGKGKLVGATVVAPTAGDIISTYALALAGKVPLKTIASFTPAYPTLAEAGKRAAVLHFAQKLGQGWVKTVLGILKRF